jgi:hypothetical protein
MTIPTHTTLTREARPLRCGEKPTEPKSPAFVFALGFAQFGLFVALLGPVIVSIGSAGPNYTLMLWTAALVALVGAAVVLPIRKVK